MDFSSYDVTMQLEHFIYASFPRLGCQTPKTLQVESLLTKKQLAYISTPVGRIESEARLQHFFPSNRTFTVSCIYPTHDDYNRACIWNHTFVLTENQYAELGTVENLESHYVRRMNFQKILEPITVTPQLKPIDKQDYLRERFGEAHYKTILNFVECSHNGFGVKLGLKASANNILYIAFALLNASNNKHVCFATTDRTLRSPELDYAFRIYESNRDNFMVKFANGNEYSI